MVHVQVLVDASRSPGLSLPFRVRFLCKNSCTPSILGPIAPVKSNLYTKSLNLLEGI